MDEGPDHRCRRPRRAALPTPTETQDHRFGLRKDALTYSGLFLMENAITHDAPGLGS